MLNVVQYYVLYIQVSFIISDMRRHKSVKYSVIQGALIGILLKKNMKIGPAMSNSVPSHVEIVYKRRFLMLTHMLLLDGHRIRVCSVVVVPTSG